MREKDLPAPEPVLPYAHLEERKATVYENLRDLQFEHRMGKLSETDYQNTKRDLQKELAGILAEVDRLKAGGAPAAAPVPAPVKAVAEKAPAGNQCPACGAVFQEDLKFCGECGKPMKAVGA